MNNEMIMLNEEELENVSGGNYWDDDEGAKSRYEVGQKVEVYDNLLHITTTTGIIYHKYRRRNGSWWYSVKLCPTGRGKTGYIKVYASDIQS